MKDFRTLTASDVEVRIGNQKKRWRYELATQAHRDSWQYLL